MLYSPLVDLDYLRHCKNCQDQLSTNLKNLETLNHNNYIKLTFCLVFFSLIFLSIAVSSIFLLVQSDKMTQLTCGNDSILNFVEQSCLMKIELDLNSYLRQTEWINNVQCELLGLYPYASNTIPEIEAILDFQFSAKEIACSCPQYSNKNLYTSQQHFCRVRKCPPGQYLSYTSLC